MKVVLIYLLLNFNMAQAFESGLCDDVVKYSTGSIISGLDRISDYFISNSNDECNQSQSLKDQLIKSIEEEDLKKFNQVMDKLESTPILQLLAKIKSGDTTELAKFRKFATEKFLVLIKRLSKNEIKIMKAEPIKTFYTFFQYNNALNFIKDNDKELYRNINIPLGKADAIRHMFINATASRFGMASFVKRLSTQRELSGGYITYDEMKWKTFNEKDFDKFHKYSFKDLLKCNPEVKKRDIIIIEHEKMLDKMTINRMDIHNNNIGIKIGNDNSCSSLKEIYLKVKAKYRSGDATEIISAGGRCFDVSSNPDKSIKTNNANDCLIKNGQSSIVLRIPRKKNNKWICN